MKGPVLLFVLLTVLLCRVGFAQELSLDDKATAATSTFEILVALYNDFDRPGIEIDRRISEEDRRLVSISIETSPPFAVSLEVAEETCEYYLATNSEDLDVAKLEQSQITGFVAYWETQYVFIMANFLALSPGAKSYIQEKGYGNRPVKRVIALENLETYPPAIEYYQQLCSGDYLEQNRQFLNDPERMAQIHKPIYFEGL